MRPIPFLIAALLATAVTTRADLLIREIRYAGTLTETEARFLVNLDIEATTAAATATLFDGNVAVLPAKLPAPLTLLRTGQHYQLTAAKPGRWTLQLTLLAKITRAEPWNTIAFAGPAAAIAAIDAQAAGAGVELQLEVGTLQESVTTDNVARLRGFLGADRTVALRWQSRAAAVARAALLTCETTATVQVTPTVLKYITALQYTIVQGSAARLSLTLPAAQTLTKLEGDGIRDWQIQPAADHQLLTIEFIKPVEQSYTLTLFSEQPVDPSGTTQATVAPPQPAAVERESGTLAITAEDVLVETGTVMGLRQVNAPAGTLAAYQYHGRPFVLTLNLRRIEPVLTVADNVTVRLEEARLLVNHALQLTVEKAGIYAVELTPQPGSVVTEVRGDGVEDWRVAGDTLVVSYSSRVLDTRHLDVQLEQAILQPADTAPVALVIRPLRLAGAAKETAQITATAVAGIQLKTVAGDLAGLQETPAVVGAGLSFLANQPDWRLTVTAERLAPRVTADIFNLITIGDGLVGGSATIRYAILNQGVSALLVRVPAHWKNVEFTGPNIRRKEQQGDTWTIGLQEKAWGGYTLVVTYDYQFDPHKAALPIGGVHVAGVERETGSLAITSAANLQLVEAAGATPPPVLRRIDELELSPNDRALITRPALLAYQYTGGDYQLNVEATRFEELPVLDAVADRTQLTTVLTAQGQMLTQASFMVKNNDRQFQRIRLPAEATLYSCFVNRLPSKPERDGDWLLVPLPRDVNRDQAFAVDVLYEQKIGSLKSVWPRRLALVAPQTDMQTTYAEWELFVPSTHRLAGFGGNMIVARGTTYSVQDAWQAFLRFYVELWRDGYGLIGIGAVVALVVALFLVARRRGWHSLIEMTATICILGVLAAMLLPSLGGRSKKARQTPEEMVTVTPLDQSLSLPAYREDRFRGEDRAGRDRPDSSATPAAPPAPVRLSGEFGGVTVNGVGSGAAVLPVAVAGIRPLRIELPRTGVRFVFTKVLNVRDEALAARAMVMESKVYAVVRGGLQAAAFVAGLALVWWQLRRPRPTSLIVTAGLALAVGAVVSLLLATRTLHWALIAALPVLVLGLVGWLVKWRWADKKAADGGMTDGGTPPETGPTPPPVPPVVAALMLALGLAGAVKAADVPETVTVQSATYTGTVREVAAGDEPAVATLAAVIELTTAAANQTVTLFGDEVAVQEFTAAPATVKLVREGGTVGVLLPKKGAATVRLKFLVKTGGDAAKRTLAFAIPPALSSRVTVTLPEPDAAVEMPLAVSLQSVTEKEQTRVESVLGAGERVELTWTPRVKRAAEIAATVFCQNTALVSLGSGVLNVRAALDYQVTQGELRQVRVRLPAGQRLMRVTGDSIRTWKLDPDGAAQMLVVELVKGMTPAYQLTVETERALDAAALAIEIPRAVDVKRETGLVALRGAEELSVTVETARDLQKVDVEEFVKAWRGSWDDGPLAVTADGPLNAYRFLKPEFELTARVEPVRPQLDAVVRNHLRLGAEQISVWAGVEYTIKKAGVFVLRLGLPAEYRLTNVTGENLAQWIEKTEAGTRVLEVTLKERTLGAYNLRVDLARFGRELPPTVDVVGVHPLDVQKLTGFVGVSAEEGLEVKPGTFAGLTEIAPAQAGFGAGVVLAYRFVQTQPQTAPGWQVTVATERLESWVRAEIVDWVTLTETLASTRAVIRYDVQSAPTKEFRLQVPAGARNVEITGANIRRKDAAADGEWRVELQHKVRGPYELTVSWETPFDLTAGTLAVNGVTALGVERETGLLAVSVPPSLQVQPQSASEDLLPGAARELPDWAGRSTPSPTLVYRYLRPGYALVVTLARFEQAAVLQAMVDNAQLTTVVAEDGQAMTEMVLAVRNNARQYLEVVLPAGAEIWSAFVAGQPVRPSRQAGKLLLPLERSVGDDAPIKIEVIYVGALKFPRQSGRVTLASPAVDVPLKNARWELYLPPDYGYGDFAGTMQRETVTTTAVRPTVASSAWGWSDYAQEETKKRAAREAEVQDEVSNVRSQLAGGKLKEALEVYGRARAKSDEKTETDTDLQQLDKDLRKAQAGNLFRGQQAFVQINASVLAGEASQAGAAAYDERANEGQWEKLQQAQEITVVRALPLRVNLPKRGVPHAFTQVLQTELRKPMTVEFDARNTKGVSWPGRVALSLAGLAVLWMIVNGALARRERSA